MQKNQPILPNNQPTFSITLIEIHMSLVCTFTVQVDFPSIVYEHIQKMMSTNGVPNCLPIGFPTPNTLAYLTYGMPMGPNPMGFLPEEDIMF